MLLYVILAALIMLSLYHLIRIRALKKQIEQAKDSFQSTLSWAKEDLRNDMASLRTVMKVIASGGRVTADMIDQGKPYSDMSAVELEKFLHQSPAPDAAVIDVRSASEYQAGHIPGAKLIPIEEIEYRLDEVPKVQTLILVCQGGTRSAAACEILSKHGFTNVINIFDGTASWPGKKEIGVAIRPPASTGANA